MYACVHIRIYFIFTEIDYGGSDLVKQLLTENEGKILQYYTCSSTVVNYNNLHVRTYVLKCSILLSS